MVPPELSFVETTQLPPTYGVDVTARRTDVVLAGVTVGDGVGVGDGDGAAPADTPSATVDASMPRATVPTVAPRSAERMCFLQ